MRHLSAIMKKDKMIKGIMERGGFVTNSDIIAQPSNYEKLPIFVLFDPIDASYTEKQLFKFLKFIMDQEERINVHPVVMDRFKTPQGKVGLFYFYFQTEFVSKLWGDGSAQLKMLHYLQVEYDKWAGKQGITYSSMPFKSQNIYDGKHRNFVVDLTYLEVEELVYELGFRDFAIDVFFPETMPSLKWDGVIGTNPVCLTKDSIWYDMQYTDIIDKVAQNSKFYGIFRNDLLIAVKVTCNSEEFGDGDYYFDARNKLAPMQKEALFQ